MSTMFIKPASLFLVFVLVTSLSFESHHQMTLIFAEARPLSVIPQQRSYARVFDTLGMICKCCDGPGGDCTSRWNGSCSNLQCIPWRFH